MKNFLICSLLVVSVVLGAAEQGAERGSYGYGYDYNYDYHYDHDDDIPGGTEDNLLRGSYCTAYIGNIDMEASFSFGATRIFTGSRNVEEMSKRSHHRPTYLQGTTYYIQIFYSQFGVDCGLEGVFCCDNDNVKFESVPEEVYDNADSNIDFSFENGLKHHTAMCYPTNLIFNSCEDTVPINPLPGPGRGASGPEPVDANIDIYYYSAIQIWNAFPWAAIANSEE